MAHVVVVGASVAGVKVVQTLRSEGFSGTITLIDAEALPLYDRPPLSKKYLAGAMTGEEIALTTSLEIEALDVETRFGVAATALESAEKHLALADGTRVRYDTLVIATGARARRTPWTELPGVHVLRTRADADGLRAEFVPGRHLAVIGAGFIGAEVAATARAADMRVSIIEPLDAPMRRALNAEVGGIFAAKYRAEGVELHLGVAVQHIQPTPGRLHLTLTDETSLDVDSVLLGIGAIVNTEWLDSSGIGIDNGVICDETLAVVGVADVYAVGDVARFTSERHPSSVRLEHWTSAVDQAFLVAHNIIHPESPRTYDPTEYVWSDQYDWKIQIVGRTESEHFAIVGDPADDRFAIVCGERAEAVEGAVIVNWPRALIDARRSVASSVSTQDVLDRLHALLEPSKAQA